MSVSSVSAVTRKTFVEFLYPGSFVDNVSTEEVQTRDPYSVKVPEGSFGFRYYDVVFATVVSEGETVELESNELNRSKTYFYGGRIMTPAQVRKEYPKQDILLRNIENNKVKRLIETTTGSIREYDPEQSELLEFDESNA